MPTTPATPQPQPTPATGGFAPIGLFDSGHGGLTVFKALATAFPHQPFIYLGDHKNAPYGEKTAADIINLTKQHVTTLFTFGCRLVLLACNTATAAACRPLQQHWLPQSPYAGSHNILGIIAPTVEVATQTPWAVTTPQYPQKLNTDIVAVFATTGTVRSNVFVTEIKKRCPKATVVQQACPALAGAIDQGAPEPELAALVHDYIRELLVKTGGTAPHWAILGCTHYPWVAHLFQRYLPASTRLLSQPDVLADSLADYLLRHPHFITGTPPARTHHSHLLTTGNVAQVMPSVQRFWPQAPAVHRLNDVNHLLQTSMPTPTTPE